jgi:hypothetical protein
MMTQKEIAALATNVESHDQFVELLQQDGFKYLNSGCFGATFGRGKKFVVKVGKEGKASGDGYVKYAEWLTSGKAPKLPEFPRISHFSRHGTKGCDWFVSIIERLEEMDRDDDEITTTADRMKDIAKHGVERDDIPETAKRAAQLIREKFAGECCIDMHYGNFMMRGKQIVITDPVA